MGLVAWLPLNNNLNNQGTDIFTISGTPSYVTGKLGLKAYDLSKRCTFTVPSLVKAKTFSIAFWYITNADDNLTGNWVDILGANDRNSADTANGEFRFETCYGDQKNNVGIGHYNNTTHAINAGFGTIISTKGTWNHICVVIDYENTSSKLYVNGSLTNTKTHNGGWLLGNFWLGQANVVNGGLQDVRLYNHALSAKEVKELSKGKFIHYALKGTGTNPNLAVNSQTLNNSSGNNGNYRHETIYYDGEAVRRFTATGSSYGPWANPFTTSNGAVVGNTYTWSMYIRSSKNVTKQIGHEAGGRKDFNLTTDWQYIKHTWTYTQSNYNAVTFYNNWAVDDWIEVKQFKIEDGSVATPYIPHVNEAKYSVISTNNKEPDLSGFGNNGTRTSIDQVNESPRYNSAIDFTAKTSHLTIPIALSTCTDLTMTIWAKFDEDTFSTSSNNTSNIIALGTNEFIRFRLNSATKMWYYINNGSIAPSFDIDNQLDNKWHFYALTWQCGVGAKFYIDGVLKNTTNNTNLKTITAINSWKLGEYNTNSETMDGQLSDFRLYATALSADDITELYKNVASIDNETFYGYGELNELDGAHVLSNGNFNTFQVNEYCDAVDDYGIDNAKIANSQTSKNTRLGKDYLIAKRIIEY